VKSFVELPFAGAVFTDACWGVKNDLVPMKN
jgi:hypothetical protein